MFQGTYNFQTCGSSRGHPETWFTSGPATLMHRLLQPLWDSVVTFITKQLWPPPSTGAALTIPALYILKMRECREINPNVVMMSGSTIGIFCEGRSDICLAGTLGTGRNYTRIEGLLVNEIQGTKGVEGWVNLRKSKPEVEGPRREMVPGR